MTVRWNAANPNGDADHHVPAVGQRRRLGERRRRHVDDPRAVWPTARRTRSRCAPSTTSARAPAATPSRRARPASRRRSVASTSSRRRAARSRATLVGAERQRQADHPLRGRPQPGRRRPTRSGRSHSLGRARRRHPLRGPRPGLQRDRLRRRGAARTRPAPTPPQPPREVTWSSYGSAQGQPGCSTSGCRYVRARGTGFQPGNNVTVTCHGAVQGGFSSTVVPGRRQRRRRRRPRLLLRVQRVVLDLDERRRVRPPSVARLIPPPHHEGHLHATRDRPASRVVQPLVQRPARQRRAGHQGQARPDRPGPRVRLQRGPPAARRRARAPARRRWPRPSPTPSRARGAASSSRPTCCRPTSPAASSTTSRRARSTSAAAPCSPTSCSPTRSTGRRRRRRPRCSR